VVLPLAVPDLPLILWCRSTRLLQMAEFWQIAAMAEKIVLDSGTGLDAAGALLRAEAVAASGTILGDLSWTRLTRWREMLAQVFENQENLARLAGISQVEVAWGGGNQVAALYLGAWIRDSLASAGVKAALKVTPAVEDTSLQVRLTGEGLALEVARWKDRMVVTMDGVAQCTNLPQPTDYVLMREELGIVRHDPVFEKTLASAARLVEKGTER
jgi:glucose-6-phosphate dehydrogenase assembly protein OpcA